MVIFIFLRSQISTVLVPAVERASQKPFSEKSREETVPVRAKEAAREAERTSKILTFETVSAAKRWPSGWNAAEV